MIKKKRGDNASKIKESLTKYIHNPVQNPCETTSDTPEYSKKPQFEEKNNEETTKNFSVKTSELEDCR